MGMGTRVRCSGIAAPCHSRLAARKTHARAFRALLTTVAAPTGAGKPPATGAPDGALGDAAGDAAGASAPARSPRARGSRASPCRVPPPDGASPPGEPARPRPRSGPRPGRSSAKIASAAAAAAGASAPGARQAVRRGRRDAGSRVSASGGSKGPDADSDAEDADAELQATGTGGVGGGVGGGRERGRLRKLRCLRERFRLDVRSAEAIARLIGMLAVADVRRDGWTCVRARRTDQVVHEAHRVASELFVAAVLWHAGEGAAVRAAWHDWAEPLLHWIAPPDNGLVAAVGEGCLKGAEVLAASSTSLPPPLPLPPPTNPAAAASRTVFAEPQLPLHVERYASAADFAVQRRACLDTFCDRAHERLVEGRLVDSRGADAASVNDDGRDGKKNEDEAPDSDGSVRGAGGGEATVEATRFGTRFSTRLGCGGGGVGGELRCPQAPDEGSGCMRSKSAPGPPSGTESPGSSAEGEGGRANGGGDAVAPQLLRTAREAEEPVDASGILRDFCDLARREKIFSHLMQTIQAGSRAEGSVAYFLALAKPRRPPPWTAADAAAAQAEEEATLRSRHPLNNRPPCAPARLDAQGIEVAYTFAAFVRRLATLHFEILVEPRSKGGDCSLQLSFPEYDDRLCSAVTLLCFDLGRNWRRYIAHGSWIVHRLWECRVMPLLRLLRGGGAGLGSSAAAAGGGGGLGGCLTRRRLAALHLAWDATLLFAIYAVVRARQAVAGRLPPHPQYCGDLHEKALERLRLRNQRKADFAEMKEAVCARRLSSPGHSPVQRSAAHACNSAAPPAIDAAILRPSQKEDSTAASPHGEAGAPGKRRGLKRRTKSLPGRCPPQPAASPPPPRLPPLLPLPAAAPALQPLPAGAPPPLLPLPATGPVPPSGGAAIFAPATTGFFFFPPSSPPVAASPERRSAVCWACGAPSVRPPGGEASSRGPKFAAAPGGPPPRPRLGAGRAAGPDPGAGPGALRAGGAFDFAAAAPIDLSAGGRQRRAGAAAERFPLASRFCGSEPPAPQPAKLRPQPPAARPPASLPQLPAALRPRPPGGAGGAAQRARRIKSAFHPYWSAA